MQPLDSIYNLIFGARQPMQMTNGSALNGFPYDISQFGATGPGADWLNWRFNPDYGSHPTSRNFLVPQPRAPVAVQ